MAVSPVARACTGLTIALDIVKVRATLAALEIATPPEKLPVVALMPEVNVTASAKLAPEENVAVLPTERALEIATLTLNVPLEAAKPPVSVALDPAIPLVNVPLEAASPEVTVTLLNSTSPVVAMAWPSRLRVAPLSSSKTPLEATVSWSPPLVLYTAGL